MSTRLTYERKKERKEERKRKEGERKGGGGREGEALAPVALVVPRALNIFAGNQFSPGGERFSKFGAPRFTPFNGHSSLKDLK